MKTLRVGFVGLGGIARSRHMPGLRRIAGVEVVAVANRSRESSEKAAQEFGIPAVYASWEELVARDDLDAVFIGTWPYMHKPISVAALNSGKHVFCQARMALNAADAQEMYDAAKLSGRVAMLCPVPFGLSVDATVSRLLRDGALGDLRLVRVQGMGNAYVDPETPLNWRKDHRLSGLNMATLGMFIEVVHRWFGWTRDVVATTQTFVSERVDPAGERIRVQIPDQILFQGALEAGFPAQYAISTCVQNGEDRIEVYGTKGTLRYEVGSDTLYRAEPGGTFRAETIAPDEAYDVQNWRVERDFIDAIREGIEYHPDFLDGLKYMQVIQAVYDSAASGQRIVLG